MKRKIGELLKITLLVTTYKFVIYFIISLLYVLLLAWAELIVFDFRYVVVGALTMLILWFMFGKYFVEQKKDMIKKSHK